MMNTWGCLLLMTITGLAFVPSSKTDDTKSEECEHPNGPRISPCKKEIILQKGQNFTLTCQANTEIQYFKQQEGPEENIGLFSIVQRNLSHENAEFMNEISLELYNVDRYAIGFYACVDKTVSEKTDVLNYLIDEPSNTEHISYIYVYVNGTDSLFAPMREVVSRKSDCYIVECRPSIPEVDVKLLVANKTPDYIIYSPKIGFVMKTFSKDAYACNGRHGNKTERKNLRRQTAVPQQPLVVGGNQDFISGETFSINCTVNYTHNSAVNLTWKYPNEFLKGITVKGNHDFMDTNILTSNITITNATKEHSGKYYCYSKNIIGEKKAFFTKNYVGDAPFLNITLHNDNTETAQPTFSLTMTVKSYPPATYTYYKNNIEIKTRKNGTYEITEKLGGKMPFLKILTNNFKDFGNYTIAATNGIEHKNMTRNVRFKVAPEIKFENSVKTCVSGMKTSLECMVTGYPLPDVTWIFSSDGKDGDDEKSSRIDVLSLYEERAILTIQCSATGTITCRAKNVVVIEEERNQTRKLVVYELLNGFGIYNQTKDKTVWYDERQNASVKCLASKYDFANVTWMIDDNDDLGEMVEYSENSLSYIAKLRINFISVNHTGIYKCRGTSKNGMDKSDDITIKVAALQQPLVIFEHNIKGNVERHQNINMHCQAHGVPRPTVIWHKDGHPLSLNNSNNGTYNNRIIDRTTAEASIHIEHVNDENIGTYDCIATSSIGEDRKSVELILKVVTEIAFTKYLIVIGVIVFVFLILVIFLTCKIKKEKRFRKELAAAGLLYFKEGVTKSINKDIGIDEQAELLPYDEKFEFPSDKLVLGKQLGAGAFGVVYKADARGIINAEETTPVAVKMVKKTADNMFIKALASELKIMVHLGKHINIVNLLGACTKNVGKRELVVIVEYCKFGNIHNYMQRHREVFIDQFSDNNKEKSFGKVNRGYDSTGSTGVQSDYGTANTQDTDHTFLTNNTNRTCRKISEGYVQPEWRSNYESDYSYDGRSPRPLTSRDLLAWAFQIARGMEYLASRKVLHGDLAARNILLADDNIVKICDFGLARSIYKNDEYQKKENSPLPVKWLAIECMTDRIFSTQSDVWSFGIVLWELFSLAKTPYPNMSPANLLQFLSEGHRLDKPAYSDDRIYNLMNRCWEQKPTSRPSFTQLQEILGTFLEDNVRNHYVDLNSPYMDLNYRPDGQEDYLAMMCSPDYNNQVTPSPHHYVNELDEAKRFFPPTPTKDEEGYEKMSLKSPASSHGIFSPKPTGTKFDFDPQKFNARPSEASSGGSELTPMLTLNNLPRSGSDSDHEGNASPYLNVCPRIDEETDEVFETKQYNAKNAQNSAVSNPTYITFGSLDVEKKPIDINNYVNIVPNGLVK